MISQQRARAKEDVYIQTSLSDLRKQRSMLAIELIEFLFSVDFGSEGKPAANNIFKELSNLLMICFSV